MYSTADYNEAKKATEVVPDGSYNYRIVSWKEFQPKEGAKKPYVKVSFTLELISGTGAGVGRNVFYQVTPADASLLFLMVALADSTGIKWQGAEFDPDAFVNATGACEVGSYQGNDGKFYNRVKMLPHGISFDGSDLPY